MPEASTAVVTSADLNMNPDKEKQLAIGLRGQFVRTVLDKGLVVRRDDTTGGAPLPIERYIIPPEVQKEIAGNPTYRDPFEISSIRIQYDGHGGDLVEVGLWDYRNSRLGNRVVFSIGEHHAEGGARQHQISLLPGENSGSEQRYYFNENPNNKAAAGQLGTFTTIQPEIAESLRALQRLPDTFRPGVRQKIANRVAPRR